MSGWAVPKEEAMSRQQCVLAGVVGLACLAIVATDLAAGKPPRPPQVPADPHVAFFEAYYISVCNEDGQRATAVYSQDGCCTTHPSLSPDLRSVVFTTLDGIKRVDFTVDGSGNVVVVGELLVLAEADVFVPTWSPDGRWIAYSKGDGTATSSSIGIVPAEGGTGITIYAPDPGVMVHDIAWKYTGDCLYFTEDVIGQAGSWVVKALQLDASGQPLGPPEVVFQDLRFGNGMDGLSAAKTRNSVAFTSGQYLYTVDLDTLQDTFVFQEQDGFHYMGTLPWSPDDSQIMFGSAPHRPPRRGIVLWKVTLATGETTTLIGGRQPDWK